MTRETKLEAARAALPVLLDQLEQAEDNETRAGLFDALRLVADVLTGDQSDAS
ncbi:MAG: hypothetical protein H6953_11465 [Chromatiaceae bacterium]|nr:hypothetical protein [Chromatiaceae bacterium]MCP5316032.1 hypothetical protein [Chromatiaceae bacterium]